jgi:anti-sigma factor RsiW
VGRAGGESAYVPDEFHLGPSQLAALSLGNLDGADEAALERHLANCLKCQVGLIELGELRLESDKMIADFLGSPVDRRRRRGGISSILRSRQLPGGRSGISAELRHGVESSSLWPAFMDGILSVFVIGRRPRRRRRPTTPTGLLRGITSTLGASYNQMGPPQRPEGSPR